MNKALPTIFLTAVLLLVGCHLGDPSAARIVSLTFVEPEGQRKSSLTVETPEVQEALMLIDHVLAANGLTQLPAEPVPRSDATIIQYKGTSTRGCSIALGSNRLEVVFVEFGRRHSTEPVSKICAELKRELAERFGMKNVKLRKLN